MLTRQLALVACALVFACTAPVVAQDGVGTVDGAIWRFSMEPLGQGQKMGGMFRVKNNGVFQKDKEDDKVWKRSVGMNHPKDKSKTRMVFTGLKTGAPKKGVIEENLKGVAMLEFQEFGHWKGRFIAEDGRHYRFSCTRVQE